MNSSPSEMKPRSPVRSHGSTGVPFDEATSLPEKVRSRLLRFLPVAGGDVLAVHPDLTRCSRRALGQRFGVDDPDGVRLRLAVAHQGRAGRVRAPLRVARRQLLGFEVRDLRRLTGPAGGDVHRRFREAVGRPDGAVTEPVTGELVGEALERRGVHALAAAQQAEHVPEVMAGQVFVRGAADRQLEGEVRCRAHDVRMARQQFHPPRRALQERHRAHHHAVQAAENRYADTEQQAHVVIEGQPRHHSGIRWGDLAEVHEEVGVNLLEVGRQVAIGDHDARGLPRRPRGVLQIRDVGAGPGAYPRTLPGALVDRVNGDDGGIGIGCPRVVADIAENRRSGEDDRGCRVAQHRGHPLVVGACLRDRKRDRDEPGLQ